jgi:hypothetical protein
MLTSLISISNELVEIGFVKLDHVLWARPEVVDYQTAKLYQLETVLSA